ncbi:CDP-alcohol phosphatidyltransferase [Actinomycetes bacterium]|nr:CDP-alcohol phosphatidyltransferase [Actinomycetes bacterium]
MLGNSKARDIGKLIATPFAKIFIKLGFSPDLVTLFGTLGVVASSIIFFSQGEFLVGSILFTMFVGLDAVDGTVARLLNRNSKWGAFFDSVLDRIADGVVLGSLAFYFANAGKETYFVLSLVALLASEIVSYTKARAEGLGLNCDTGLAERPERVIIIVAGTFFTGLGINPALEISIWLLTIVSIITVIQRMNFVLKQTKSS